MNRDQVVTNLAEYFSLSKTGKVWSDVFISYHESIKHKFCRLKSMTCLQHVSNMNARLRLLLAALYIPQANSNIRFSEAEYFENLLAQKNPDDLLCC